MTGVRETIRANRLQTIRQAWASARSRAELNRRLASAAPATAAGNSEKIPTERG